MEGRRRRQPTPSELDARRSKTPNEKARRPAEAKRRAKSPNAPKDERARRHASGSTESSTPVLPADTNPRSGKSSLRRLRNACVRRRESLDRQADLSRPGSYSSGGLGREHRPFRRHIFGREGNEISRPDFFRIGVESDTEKNFYSSPITRENLPVADTSGGIPFPGEPPRREFPLKVVRGEPLADPFFRRSNCDGRTGRGICERGVEPRECRSSSRRTVARPPFGAVGQWRDRPSEP